jgi:hypothetical protein
MQCRRARDEDDGHSRVRARLAACLLLQGPQYVDHHRCCESRRYDLLLLLVLLLLLLLLL